MRERKYLLNNKPIDFVELINQAKQYDKDFANEPIQFTSRASVILRKHGFTVEETFPKGE